MDFADCLGTLNRWAAIDFHNPKYWLVLQAIANSANSRRLVWELTLVNHLHSWLYLSVTVNMCYVIVTCRSLLWTLLTIIATLFLVVSVCSPYWMIGQVRKTGLVTLNNTSLQDQDTFRPTVGIFNRCYRLHKFQNILHRDSCDTYVIKFDMPNDSFPNTWKAALIFYILGVFAMIFTMVTSVISLCMRSLCGKSIFTLSGLIQSIAGKWIHL